MKKSINSVTAPPPSLRYPSSRSTILAAICVIFLTANAAAQTSSTAADVVPGPDLLETGAAAKFQPPFSVPAEIKVISYNIRWRGGDDLLKLIEYLRSDPEIGGAEIIGLQEVDRGKKRTDGINTARRIAEALGMSYAWAAPPRTEDNQAEDETGVAILSKYAMIDVERLVLPNAGPGGRRRAAVGATVLVGDKRVRVYSAHAETRIPVDRKVEQFRAVLNSLESRPQENHAIVLGDLNTIKSKDVTRTVQLFTDAGFSTPLPQDRPTWRFYFIKLKLDWVWLKGIDATGGRVVRRITLSDHWPMWVRVKLRAGNSTAVTSK
ncbi:MAG: endonuclease/exonuclease/phosphatase family protein [Pyrinomonadaceae bacterium]